MKLRPAMILVFCFLFQAAEAQVSTQNLLLYWSFNSEASAPEVYRNGISTRGYAGGSFSINATEHCLLDRPINIRKRFSVNFWYKPTDYNANQSIFTLACTNYSEIEFGIADQSIYCAVNGLRVEHFPYMVLDNDWSMVSLTFDGKVFHLTLFSSGVTSTSHFAVSSFITQPIQSINFASGKNSPFNGLLDELMIYAKETPTTELEKMYDGALPQNKNALASTKPVVAPIPVPKKNTTVESKKVENNPSPKSQPKTYWAGEVQVNNKSLILEISNWKKLAQKYNVKLNGKQVMNAKQDPTGITLLELDTDESNALTFEPLEKNKLTMPIQLKLSDEAGVVNDTEITPHESLSTTYNITHRFENKTITEVQRTVKVTKRQLHIEVWDDKISDGDFVSIYYNNEKLIDYQEVTKEKIHIDLNVMEEGSNLISFIAEDAGKYGNNSAKVRILENGKLVDEFTFTSTYRKKAGLLIQVQGKN